MLTSTDRILTTHVGSLPRNETLSDLLIRQEAGETIDTSALAREIESATRRIIENQVKAGVDIGNDGEQSRVGFQTYVPRCMCGFGGESKRPPARDQPCASSQVPAGATGGAGPRRSHHVGALQPSNTPALEHGSTQSRRTRRSTTPCRRAFPSTYASAFRTRRGVVSTWSS